MTNRVLAVGDRDILAAGLVDGLEKLNIRGVVGSLEGRIRVTQAQTRHSVKHVNDNQPLIFDDAQTSGSGTSSTYNSNKAAVTLAVSANTAGTRVRQTFNYFDYEPNKTSLYSSSFVMGKRQPGITKRIGQFNENNGLFIEQTGEGEFWVIRSNTSGAPVDRRFNLADSNLDSVSALGIDFSKIQNINIFYNWYGAGNVVFAFQRDREIELMHKVRHDNVLDGVYMRTPELPVRFEISNDGTGGAASMDCIASGLIIEGTSPDDGLPFGVSRGASAISPVNAGDWVPLISTRIQPTYIGREVIPLDANVAFSGSGIYEIGLFRNPTIAGTDNAVWQQYTGAGIEYDISRDETNIITGQLIEVVTDASSNQSSGRVSLTPAALVTYGVAIDNTPEEIIVAVRYLTGNGGNFYGTFNWLEFI